jgi:4-amino-4-deoxy-L-arabinose transferase-like glycosyltransferase
MTPDESKPNPISDEPANPDYSAGLSVETTNEPLVSDQGPATDPLKRPGRVRTQRAGLVAWPPPPPPAEPRRRVKLLCLLGLVVFTLTLRMPGLGSISFWQDEALCWINAMAGPQRTVEILASQNQPPGYHILLRGWMEICSYGDDSARLLSVICSTLSVVLLFHLVAAYFGASTGFLAGAIGASSVFWIIFAREATMYSLTLVLSLASVALFLHLTREAEQYNIRRNWVGWLTLGLLRACLIYVHYIGFFLILGEVFVVLYLAYKMSRRALLAAWIGAHILTLLAFLPWLPTFLEQRARVAEGFWTQALSPGRIVNVARQWCLYIPEINHTPWNLFLLLPFIACLLAAFWLCRFWITNAIAGLLGFAAEAMAWSLGRKYRRALPPRERPRNRQVEALTIYSAYLVIPLLGVLLVSLSGTSLFEPKYLIPFSAFFYAIISVGLATGHSLPGVSEWRRGSIKQLVAGGGLFIVANLAAAYLHHSNGGYQHPDLRGATEHIISEWTTGDVVLTLHPETLSGFTRYTTDLPPRPVFMYSPGGRPPFYEGLGAFEDLTFIDDLDLMAVGHQRVWMLFWDNFSAMPWESTPEKVAALDAHAQGMINAFGAPDGEVTRLQFNKLRLYLIPVKKSFDFPLMYERFAEWIEASQKNDSSRSR